MRRLIVLGALCVIALSRLQEVAHAKVYVSRFDIKRSQFFSTCREGGERREDVQRRYSKAFVTNCTYYSMPKLKSRKARSKRHQKESGPFLLIDLYWKMGRYLHSYRWDWGRPVLVTTRSDVRIDRPGKYHQWKPRPGDLEAMAIDDFEQPDRVMWRQMIGIKDGQLIIAKASHATYYDIQHYMRWKLRVTNYASFDGGHSCEPGARIVTCFCIKPKPYVLTAQGEKTKRGSL